MVVGEECIVVLRSLHDHVEGLLPVESLCDIFNIHYVQETLEGNQVKGFIINNEKLWTEGYLNVIDPLRYQGCVGLLRDVNYSSVICGLPALLLLSLLHIETLGVLVYRAGQLGVSSRS